MTPTAIILLACLVIIPVYALGIVFCLAFCQAAYLSDRQNTQEGDKQHV